MCHRQFFNFANVIKDSRGKKSLALGREPRSLTLLVAVSIAKTRGEMRRGEGENGHEDLSSDEDHAITLRHDGSIALSRETKGGNRRAALGPISAFRFYAVVFNFMPEHLASRLGFIFGAFPLA